MICIKLNRDQLRYTEANFFFYIERMCAAKIAQEDSQDDLYQLYIIQEQFFQVKKIIQRKLLTTANSFTLDFTFSQASVWQKLLLLLPIEREKYYSVTPRNLWVNLIQTAIDQFIILNKKPVQV